MMAPTSRRQWLGGLLAGLCAPAAWAHAFKAGGLRLDHPYATPTLAGTRIGAVYFRGMSNQGPQADRLLAAETAVAATVEIHRMALDGQGVMRMRELEAVDLPAGAAVAFRHDQRDGHHLMLRELKAPLKQGDRFKLRLRFEQAGWQEVVVWVQNPRQSGAHQH